MCVIITVLTDPTPVQIYNAAKHSSMRASVSTPALAVAFCCHTHSTAIHTALQLRVEDVGKVVRYVTSFFVIAEALTCQYAMGQYVGSENAQWVQLTDCNPA